MKVVYTVDKCIINLQLVKRAVILLKNSGNVQYAVIAPVSIHPLGMCAELRGGRCSVQK